MVAKTGRCGRLSSPKLTGRLRLFPSSCSTTVRVPARCLAKRRWHLSKFPRLVSGRCTDTMTNVIQTLWVNGALSVMERLSLNSFLKHGHEVHLYTYGPVGQVPKGVVLRDGNEVILEKDLFLVKGGYSTFSDFFRWKLIRERGGWWCDTDTICLKRFDFPGDYVFVGGLGAPGSNDCVSSGMFRAPAMSPITDWA